MDRVLFAAARDDFVAVACFVVALDFAHSSAVYAGALRRLVAQKAVAREWLRTQSRLLLACSRALSGLRQYRRDRDAGIHGDPPLRSHEVPMGRDHGDFAAESAHEVTRLVVVHGGDPEKIWMATGETPSTSVV